jgi:hypothetical protein
MKNKMNFRGKLSQRTSKFFFTIFAKNMIWGMLKLYELFNIHILKKSFRYTICYAEEVN